MLASTTPYETAVPDHIMRDATVAASIAPGLTDGQRLQMWGDVLGGVVRQTGYDLPMLEACLLQSGASPELVQEFCLSRDWRPA